MNPKVWLYWSDATVVMALTSASVEPRMERGLYRNLSQLVLPGSHYELKHFGNPGLSATFRAPSLKLDLAFLPGVGNQAFPGRVGYLKLTDGIQAGVNERFRRKRFTAGSDSL
jgi:hypothetical protein